MRAWARAGATLAILALGLGGCSAEGVLDPKGTVGASEKVILFDSLAIMLCIIVPTIVLTLGAAWWWRASNGRATYMPDWAYSGRLELVVWSIPILTIMFLGGIAWIGSHDLDPAKPLASRNKPLDVQVVALDWKWLFIYPDQHMASVNKLVIPVGTPVHFSLTSASVLNSFFIPGLGSMIYAMNGMADQLNLEADKPGRYMGMSSHYSGDGFSGMHFDVSAVPTDRFNNWVAQTKAGGGSLDRSTWPALAKQSQDVKPFTYASADPNLFDDVVLQRVAPGPGPGPGANGQSPTVSPKGGR